MPEFKQQSFEYMARVARAIGNKNRLLLLDLLAQRSYRVEMLARLSGMSVANASKHLQSLREAGLVQVSQSRNERLYRLAGDEIVELVTALREVSETFVAELKNLVQDTLGVDQDMRPVGPDELLQAQERGDVVVLDVRPGEEYEAGHIPGAINVPIDQLEDRLADIPKEREVVAYCRGPYCLWSTQAVEWLKAREHRARRLELGLPEWRAAGYDTETGDSSSDD